MRLFVVMWEAYRLASLAVSLWWPWEPILCLAQGLSCRSVWAFVRAWPLCARADWHTVLCVLWMSKSCKQAGPPVVSWVESAIPAVIICDLCHQRSVVAPSNLPNYVHICNSIPTWYLRSYTVSMPTVSMPITNKIHITMHAHTRTHAHIIPYDITQ